MIRRHLLGCAALLLAAAGCYAQGKPDFSGEWKMNKDKSSMGQFPLPDSASRTIEHKEPEIRMVSKMVGQMGEMVSEFKYSTDGKEHVNKVRNGEAKSVLKWDGSVLVVTTKRPMQDGGELTTVERWSLSADGKTLTSDGKFQSPMGELETKMVFDKQ